MSTLSNTPKVLEGRGYEKFPYNFICEMAPPKTELLIRLCIALNVQLEFRNYRGDQMYSKEIRDKECLELDLIEVPHVSIFISVICYLSSISSMISFFVLSMTLTLASSCKLQ